MSSSSDTDNNEDLEHSKKKIRKRSKHSSYDPEEGNERSDDERTQIRSELSEMSFEDLMKLKGKLGTKVYNEALFGKKVTSKNVKKDFKRENKNRPREMGVKRPVPFLGKQKTQAPQEGPRDPRFDSKCGEFDANKFRENFGFVDEIKEKELIELKSRLQIETDPKEHKKIKYLIQRMQNQNTEREKQQIRKKVVEEEKEEIKKAKQEYKKPHFVTHKERKARELVKQYLELKTSGKLDKHLEKRRKKNAGRDRKKFSFD